MSSADALIIALPEGAEDAPTWMRVVDGAIVQTGAGANWLAACGLVALPDKARVMLVPPAALVALHWVSHPDLPARQGRERARLVTLRRRRCPEEGRHRDVSH